MNAPPRAVTVSLLGPDDAGALLDLERRGQRRPWTRAQLDEELIPSADRWVLGARDADGALVGYLALRAMVDELWILNVAVLPDARRQGVGRTLVEAAKDRAAGTEQPLWLEVRSSNHAARALYGAAGFAEMGVRPRYYPPEEPCAPREDAVQMRFG